MKESWRPQRAITMRCDQRGRGGDCACGGRIVEPDGERVCGSCGIVFGYEVVAASGAAAAAGPVHFNSGPRTTMGCLNTDFAGRSLARLGAARVMRKRDTWSQRRRKSIQSAMMHLSKWGDELGMTGASAEYAAYLFQKAASSGFLVGRRVTHCTAAAALLACRKHGINRTVHDIMRVTGLARRDICRTYRQLYEMFDPDLPVPDPVSYIARIGAEVGVSEAARRGAQDILTSMDRTEIAGKDPMGLAAGVLYLACVNRGEAVLRRDIAEAAGVAETTLSARFEALAGTKS